jgi:hypothetical protein
MLVALTAISAAGSACAMSSPTPPVDCRVVGGGKLPAETGGADAVCKAISLAAGKVAPGRRFSVEVKVLGRSALAATVTTADGSILPEQKMASSDRSLTRGSIERFARALAGAVAQAPGP